MDILINGLLLGSGYAMMGIGFALLFGVAKVFDLAYGSYFILAPYIVVAVLPSLIPHIGLGGTLFIALAIVGAIGYLIHWALITPLRDQHMSVFILTISLALAIQEVMVALWSSQAVNIPSVWEGTTEILGVPVINQKLAILGVSIAVIAVLWLVLNKMKPGIAIRVVAEKPEAGRIVGIRIKRIYGLTAVIGSVIAGISGFFMCALYSATPYGWGDAMTLGFIVIILAGLGNIWAVLPAGLIIGFIETIVAFSSPQGAFLKRPAVLILLILLLTFRPSGLFGVKGWEEES